MKSTSYKVKIQASVNGTTVAPKSIAWIRGNDSCLAMPCYKENDYFVIELIPDCIGGNCIEGYITFGDQCDNCEPVYFKKCFCNNSDDCSECEECNQYGLCQSICLADEFCNNGQCCNCDQNTPCTGNKTCNGCKCVCPQGTFEKNGTCVQCDENTILDKCHICVNGIITPIPCDGACDPSTGGCVDCLTGGDCSGREDGKVCCVNKQCVCCDGTIYDPVAKKCVPQPCKDDAECGTCKKCTPEGCKPIECPIGYQCINDECVPECANATCNNGADCGENCGCLDGKCVPCTILSCLDEASCQAALGCKCSGDNCVPVDNCNEYCDGSTPCLDTNCTCYNNNCVSCENFPCVDTEGGCNSYYNCKCNDQAQCEGGKDCEDTFELKKNEACSADGCELQAIYKSKNKCMCDPIEFKVANTKVCGDNPDNDPILLNLSVKMFKRGVEYSQFKTSDKFSDTELVTGSIRVVTTVGTSSTTVTKDVSNENIIPTITIPKPTLTDIKLVKVTVFTQSIKVNANGCTAYDNKQIAYYEFDFSKSTIENCTKLTNYKKEQIFKLTDTKSTKKPLLVWYRTSGDDFGTTPVSLTSKNYTDKGFFRKLYLTGVGGSFSDKITKPEEGLLNNFRYKVTIDCGCEGANVATTGDVVIYCCPKDLTFISDNTCGKTLKLQPFTNCSVNKQLDLTKYPVESNTKYFVSLNGKAPKLLSTFQTVGSEINITDDEAIKTLEFYQGYDGNPVVKKACEKTFEFNPTLPDFGLNTTEACVNGKIVVTNNNINISISTVKATVGTTNYTFVKTGNLYIATIPPSQLVNVNLEVEVEFSNGCKNKKSITIVCSPSIDTESEPTTFARGTCPSGGDNPKLVITPSGFGSGVVYSLNNGPFQSSNEFFDVPAGTYTLTAKETIGGIEYTATDTITIEQAIQPTASFAPSNICQGSSSSLIITGVPGSNFSIYNPSNLLVSSVTIPTSGTISIPGFNEPGSYNVVLNAGAPSKSCSPFSATAILSVGGQQLSPQIEVQPGNYCVGEPIPFRIVDGGVNATYTLSSLATGTITSPLQANQFSYNGTFTPSSSTGYIKITGADGTCNTSTTPQVTVNTTVGPVITSVTSLCQTNNQYTVTVVATGATGVTVGGVAATSTGPNTWQRTNIDPSTLLQLFNNNSGPIQTPVIVSNNSCSVSQTLTLQNCLCPQGEVYIDSGGNTCGQGNTTIFYNGTSGITPNSNWTYVFQNFSPLLQEWGNVGVPGTFNPLSTPTLSVATTEGVTHIYRLKLTNTINNCEYISDQATVTAAQPPLNINITPSVPTGSTGQVVTFSTTQSNDYTYSWTGAVTGSTYQSNPVTFTTPGTYTINLQVCSAQGCCTTATLGYVVGLNCEFPPIVSPLVATYTDACSDIQVQYQLTSGTGAVTYTVSGTYVNVSSTPVPGNGTIIVPTTAIPPGATDSLTITVTDSTGCTVTSQISYDKVGCVDANIIYFVDNSGSVEAGEFTKISSDIINSSQKIHQRSSNSTFSVIHYGTSVPAGTPAQSAISTQINGQTTPITTVTRAYTNGSNDYLQESLALLNTALTGLSLNSALPTYLFVYTDAIGGGGSGSKVASYGIEFSNDNDCTPSLIGINCLLNTSAPGCSCTPPITGSMFPESDLIKTSGNSLGQAIEIVVVGYPSGFNDSIQQKVNQALAAVASPGKFYYNNTYNTDISENVLNSLGCTCTQ